MLAIKVAVPGGRLHFGLSVDKWYGPVLPNPFGCCEISRECCKLLDKVLHGVEGEFPKKDVKRDSFRPSSHHLGDGSHSCCDRCHGCAVSTL